MTLGCSTVGKDREVWLRARATTVLVRDQIGSLGTGNVINPRCIITAGHVADVDDPVVTTASGTEYPMKKVAHNDQDDLAVACGTKDLDAPAVSFGPTPTLYEPVFTIGFPLGEHWVLTLGHYQDRDLITTPCAPGNSGGGVFTSDGAYVGLVDSLDVLRKEEFVAPVYHLCNIISGTTIKKFLTTNKIDFNHERRTL